MPFRFAGLESPVFFILGGESIDTVYLSIQANYLQKELNKLLNVVYFAGDYRVYQATKDTVELTVDSLFGPLTSEQKSLFAGITEIKGQKELNEVMNSLRPYVIPFPVDADKVRRLFKKEKKLVVPDFEQLDLRTISYLGWRDIAKNHIYLVYPYFGELIG